MNEFISETNACDKVDLGSVVVVVVKAVNR
jgi:hypothetical protein